jgi:hypothetical protein
MNWRISLIWTKTPVWFNMAGNFIINPNGKTMAYIRAMGNEKN